MKNLFFFEAITFSFLSAFALNCGYCDEEVKQKESEKSIAISPTVISSITLAFGTKGDDLEPLGQSGVFKPTDTVHAVVRVIDAPANTKVSASWFVVNVGSAAEPDSLILSAAVTAEGTRNLDFTLKPTQPFPQGTYRVEVSVDGELDTDKIFTVKP